MSGVIYVSADSKHYLKILGEKNVRGHLCFSQLQTLPNNYLQMCRESRVLHLSNE